MAGIHQQHQQQRGGMMSISRVLRILFLVILFLIVSSLFHFSKLLTNRTTPRPLHEQQQLHHPPPPRHWKDISNNKITATPSPTLSATSSSNTNTNKSLSKAEIEGLDWMKAYTIAIERYEERLSNFDGDLFIQNLFRSHNIAHNKTIIGDKDKTFIYEAYLDKLAKVTDNKRMPSAYLYSMNYLNFILENREPLKTHTLKDVLHDPPRMMVPRVNPSESNDYYEEHVNLIRIPKAGSSYISITARALAGCDQMGLPCCIKMHDGAACPAKGLWCREVMGCVDHVPDYQAKPFLPVITQIREPTSRFVSSFFYKYPHKLKEDCFSWECFEEQVKDNNHQNILIKMLSGTMPYGKNKDNRERLETARKRICSIAWYGISDMQLPSKLLLYEQEPFQYLNPNPVVFDLTTEGEINDVVMKKKEELGEGEHPNDFLRKNADTQARRQFMSGDFIKKDGVSLTKEHNKEDILLYQFALELFCLRLRSTGIIQYASEFHDKSLFDGCNEILENNPSNPAEHCSFVEEKM